MPWMTFPALDALREGGIAHRFTLRHPEMDVNEERQVVVERLWSWHRQQAAEMGFDPAKLCIAEQVHGNEVAVIDEVPAQPVPGTDGLITNVPGLVLGIYVADCGAVFIVDARTGPAGCFIQAKKAANWASRPVLCA